VGYLMLLLSEVAGTGSPSGGGSSAGQPRTAPGSTSSGPLAPVRTGRRIGAVALAVASCCRCPRSRAASLDAAGTGVGAGHRGRRHRSPRSTRWVCAARQPERGREPPGPLSLRTDSNDLSDMYLRIVSLDDFDGITSGKPSQRHIEGVPDKFPTPTGLGADVKRA
ncbi:transglutaminase, partial [Streptomyces sp. L7]